MTIKEKIKYLVIGVLISAAIWFLYSTYRQIQVNKQNIQSIGNFLNRAQPAQTAPAKPPVEKEEPDAGK